MAMATTVSNSKRTKLGEEEVKAAIVSHLQGLTTNSTVAMGRLEPSIPQQPLLKIEGYGTVGLPVSWRVASEVGQFMEEAPYGMGEDTILDKNVRDTLQVGPDKFQITNKRFSEAILTDVVETVKLELGLEKMEVWAEPYKLLLYKPGGHFKPHRDTEKAAGMFATLIVQLPSEFTGGDLVVRHGGKEIVVKMSQEGSASSCLIAAHYSDCEHEITPVETGYRLALVYSLCWTGAGQAPSADEVVNKATSLKSLLLAFTKESEKSPARLCWGLEHLYSENAVKKTGSGALKGNDRGLVETLMNTNQMLEKDDQLEVFLAKASQVRHEYGSCENEGDRYGYRSCGSDCFELCGCDDIETKLSDFIPLTGGDLDMEDEEFDAEEEVLNFEDEDEFWGEGKGECSGPSGNEGASRDMWYNKWVVVMWRKADAFMIKFQASHVAGLQHILNTCQEGDMLKAKEEVEEVLRKPLEHSWRIDKKVVEVALDLALVINDQISCKKVMEKFLVSRNEMSESELAKLSLLITKYTWPVLKASIFKQLEKADSISSLAVFAKFFCSIGTSDVSVCEQILSKMKAQLRAYNPRASIVSVLGLILKFPSDLAILGKQLASVPCMSTLDMIVNVASQLAAILATDQTGLPVLEALEERFLLQLGKQANISQNLGAVTKMVNIMVKLNRKPDVTVCIHVLSQMKAQGSSNVTAASIISVLDLVMKFPSDLAMLGKQLLSLPCMSTLDMIVHAFSHLATILATDETVLPCLVALEEKFFLQAGITNLSQKSAVVTKMMNIMVKLKREASVQAMSRIILGQPNHQYLLSALLSTVSAATVPMPAAMLTLVRARVAFLQAVVTRGPPAFSWRQSTAVVPGHPRVQEFFRGDQKQFIYREFTNIKHARSWARKHSNDMGTDASFTPGGQGSKAHVLIIKNKEAFERLELAVYSKKLEEYQRLIACLPPDSVSVTVQPVATATIDLTED